MELLLVDGYNMIGAWPELQKLKEMDLAVARERLIEKMAEYQAYCGIKVLIVFDAYASVGGEKKSEQYLVDVIFTKEKETADERIEKMVGQLNDVRTRVYVATSDMTEQWEIFGRGALRKSAGELLSEVEDVEQRISLQIKAEADKRPLAFAPISENVWNVFDKWRRGDK